MHHNTDAEFHKNESQRWCKKGHLPLLVSKERKRMHQKSDADYDESVWSAPLFSLKEAERNQQDDAKYRFFFKKECIRKGLK